MLGASSSSCFRALPRFAAIAAADQTSGAGSCLSNLRNCSISQVSIQVVLRTRRRRQSKLTQISCHSFLGSSVERSTNAGHGDHGYLEASILISETKRHYRMRNRGFEEETRWKPPNPAHLPPLTARGKDPRAETNSIGVEFLRRFQNPTIFLKISCDGDFILPIIVGEFAVERLIDGLDDADENKVCPDEFHLVKQLVGKLGYEVVMVKITERVVSTYFARVYFSKPGEKDILSVDARPSDAINIAYRCKAPVYVNKQIVLADATQIVYGLGRVRDHKATYDVFLDSAADGPDLLSEELHLVRNMDMAVDEERYKDAAIWKDRLGKLRKSMEH